MLVYRVAVANNYELTVIYIILHTSKFIIANHVIIKSQIGVLF